MLPGASSGCKLPFDEARDRLPGEESKDDRRRYAGRFFALFVRPVLLLILGVNIRNRERLPAGRARRSSSRTTTSHLDTMALISMIPLSRLPKLTPCRSSRLLRARRCSAGSPRHIIGILPIDRSGQTPRDHLLDGAIAALDEGKILILFPEGTRGEPEELATFKKGVAHLAKARPQVPVTPVFMHGLGKALPRGTYILVPFNCDVFVGEAFRSDGTVPGLMTDLEARMQGLAAQGQFPPWD